MHFNPLHTLDRYQIFFRPIEHDPISFTESERFARGHQIFRASDWLALTTLIHNSTTSVNTGSGFLEATPPAIFPFQNIKYATSQAECLGNI